MAKCVRCGNKISIFEVTVDGLCPSCNRLSSPGAIEKAKKEEAMRNEAIARAEQRKQELQRMLDSGDLPELPCMTPKALKLVGNNLVFVNKKENISVPLQNIVSFSLKRPSFSANYGTITVQLPKSNDAVVSLTSWCAVGLGNEMTAMFSPEYLEIAELYEKYVLKKNNEPQKVYVASQCSEAIPTINDLRALKVLVDEGVLTEEEFTAKKKQLLGI